MDKIKKRTKLGKMNKNVENGQKRTIMDNDELHCTKRTKKTKKTKFVK